MFSHIISALTNNLFRITLLTMIAVRITQQTDDPYNIVVALFAISLFMITKNKKQASE